MADALSDGVVETLCDSDSDTDGVRLRLEPKLGVRLSDDAALTDRDPLPLALARLREAVDDGEVVVETLCDDEKDEDAVRLRLEPKLGVRDADRDRDGL